MKHLKTKAALLAAALVLPFSNPAEAAVIGPNGNSYDIVRADGITWTDANNAANALGNGWHLATICDEAENDFVNKLRVAAGMGQVWLGGFQNPAGETTATAGWTWVNGEGSFSGVNGGTTYSNWHPGEPNDNYGPGSEQYLGIGLFGGSTWNDEGNLGLIYGYVIEQGAVHCPDGGSSILLAGAAMSLVGMIRSRFRR